MTIWQTILDHQTLPNSISPLFWQHGESESVLRDEIRQMHAGGMGGFIVESRPHPNFLGDRWWHDLDVILDEAKKHGMRVWIFDDSAYPSGFSAGLIKSTHPEFLKRYLALNQIDVIGPLTGSSFFINSWLDEGDRLVRVIAARRAGLDNDFDAGSLVDLTGWVVDGVLYWDVPAGNFRVFVVTSTRNGGEEWTRDYLNPLMPEAVNAYLDFVYEPHYAHYASEFGKTIAGFFSDEPRFGNAATYEASIGRYKMVLPDAPDLLNSLNKAWGEDFSLYLPCLWFDGGDPTSRARYTYMDVVSRLFAQNFSQQIGNWCRAHAVQLIGHIVEDNGAHARLGFGPGHFFRAISGQDMSGLDMVYQVWPAYHSGRFTTPFGYLDADFFYWGIAKMASSAGHIDPQKNGLTMVEAFGAYGWQEGLKLMKWLTDHACVRGVNFIVPHAFSPKANDPDCPPHFYARGLNPQWKYFSQWSGYANQVCQLLTGGLHVAPVAVLYHAEAEWAGDYEPFERVVKTLALSQIDVDILPVDTLAAEKSITLEPDSFCINHETYRAMVIPYSERLPVQLLPVLSRLAENGVPVIFMRDYAKFSGSEDLLERLKLNPRVMVGTHANLVGQLKHLGLADITVSNDQPDLRYYHYKKEGADLFFFTNESRTQPINTVVTLHQVSTPVGYDAMSGRLFQVAHSEANGEITIDLRIDPYNSIFVVFDPARDPGQLPFAVRPERDRMQNLLPLSGEWQISRSGGAGGAGFIQTGITALGNVSKPGLLPNFSGTIRYDLQFKLNRAEHPGAVLLDLGDVYEIADVYLNGRPVGVRICPPYCFEVTNFLLDGDNRLQVDVTNTLAKEMGSRNVFDRAMPQEPSGLLGPVRLLWGDEDSLQAHPAQ